MGMGGGGGDVGEGNLGIYVGCFSVLPPSPIRGRGIFCFIIAIKMCALKIHHCDLAGVLHPPGWHVCEAAICHWWVRQYLCVWLL